MLAITRCTPDDLPQLETLARDVFNAQFASYFSASGLETYLAQQFDPAQMARDIAGERTRFYFARLDGQVIGYAKLILDRPIPVGDKADGAEIEKVYFMPGAIGLGHGGAVIGHLLHEAAAAGAPFVWLDVLKTNERAIKAYMRQGFEIVGEVPFATDIMDIGFFVMRRVLPSSTRPG